MRLNLALDCDGVTASFHESMIAWHNRTYGTKHVREDIGDFHLRHLWGCTVEEEFRRLNEFYKTKEFMEIPPLEGAVENVGLLADNGFNIFTITARPEQIYRHTREWLEAHFPGKFKEKLFSRSYEGNARFVRDKPALCKDYGIGTIVEDNLDNALACYRAGINVILFNQPWNIKTRVPSGIARADNWREVYEIITDISKG